MIDAFAVSEDTTASIWARRCGRLASLRARKLYERALVTFGRDGVDNSEAAMAKAGLAMVLPASERTRALELAAEARNQLGQDRDGHRLRRDLAKWESVPR